MNRTWSFRDTGHDSDKLSFGRCFDLFPIFIIDDESLSNVAIWRNLQNVAEFDGPAFNLADYYKVLVLFVNFEDGHGQTRDMCDAVLLTQVVDGVQNLEEALASIPIIELIMPATAGLVNALTLAAGDGDAE